MLSPTTWMCQRSARGVSPPSRAPSRPCAIAWWLPMSPPALARIWPSSVLRYGCLYSDLPSLLLIVRFSHDHFDLYPLLQPLPCPCLPHTASMSSLVCLEDGNLALPPLTCHHHVNFLTHFGESSFIFSYFQNYSLTHLFLCIFIIPSQFQDYLLTHPLTSNIF